MAVPGFSSPKCEQRSRIAAARFGVEAVPLRLRGQAPIATGSDGFLALAFEGSLPETPQEALALINARLPEGASPLGEGDVFLHFYEAANSNFVGDRFLFLGDTTLKNIASGGNDGVSFMNSHRTGGMSEPTELPFGQSFCGCYEEGFDAQGRAVKRATIGVFLVKGIKPNGNNGPSTNDLDAMFRAGAIKDVSVGLSGGDTICDVCGYGLNQRDEEGDSLCPHVPGTHRGMPPEQIETQKQRDPLNAEGFATYSLHNAHLNELSAVYDGAVPGAGVRKVMSFARGADMTRADVRQVLQEAYAHFGALLPFDLGELVELKDEAPTTKTMFPKKTKLNAQDVPPVPAPVSEPEPEETPEVEPVEGATTDEPEPENESLAVKNQRLQTELAQARAQLAQSAKGDESKARAAFAKSLEGKVAPVAREQFTKLFEKLQSSGGDAAGLQHAISEMPTHPALSVVPADVELSEVASPTAGGEDVSAARKSGQDFARRQQKARAKTGVKS